MAKVSRPVVYTVLFGLAAYALMLYTEPEPAAVGARKPRAKTAVVKRSSGLTDADYTAKFEALNEKPKNAFKPLVIRDLSGLAGLSRNINGIPANLTGGDPNWIYSGLAEVNGERMALLENTANGEGVFLRHGERWKRVVVSSISSEALVLISSDGTVRTVRMGERSNEQDELPEVTTEVAPLPVEVPSELEGAIGSNIPARNPGIGRG